MALKKPSDLFGKKTEDISIPVIESDNSFRDELNRVESLSEQVIQLQQELSQKVIKSDLESLVLSQINTMQENFEYLQNDFKKSNKKDIVEFKERVSELTEIVGNLVENELPKYRKQVTKNEVRIGDKFDELKEVVEENIVDIRGEIDSKVNDIAEVIDNNLEYFNNQLQETSSEVKKTTDTYNKLSKIVENRISKENEKLEEYSQVIQSLHEAFIELENSLQEETSTYNQIIEEKFATISSDVKSTIHNIDENVNNKINSIDEDVDTFKNQVSSDISSIKADVVIFEKHNKDTEKTIQEFSEQLHKISEIDESIGELNEDIGKLQNQYDSISNQSIETKKDLEVVERYIQNHHQELVELKEEVFGEIEQIPVGNIQENLERLEKKIDYIKETYSKIEPEVIVKEVIKEGLLNEPPETKNSDPLTPLDQNFVTLDQLQKHYSLFINRIQQQLSTIGGGGETRLKYLDDIVGISTNASAYDGKYLKYNHSLGKFEFTDVDITNDSWVDGVSGPYTLGSVGIGTTNPQTKLDISGDIRVSSGSTFVFGTGLGVGQTAPGYTYALSNPFTSVQIGGTANRRGNALVDITAVNYPDATNVLNIQATSETYTGTIGTYKPYTPAGTVIEIGNTRASQRVGIGSTLFGRSAALISIYAYNNDNVTNAFFGAVAGDIQNGPSNFVFGRRTGASSWEETVRIDTSGNLGIGVTNPTAKLDVSGDLNGTAFESYELDDISSAADGTENTFTPKFNYDRVTITNPFRLMVTVNGIPQSAFINNTDYVHQSNFLGSNNGFTIDTDNNIKFTESIPLGSDIVARVLPVSNTATRIKFYPFKPADILLGY